MKHLPFNSIYRPDFEVVEQRHGRVSMFPHTDQLPVLLRALNLEFYGALPSCLARVDHRAEDYRKITLRTIALLFCGRVNDHRPDGLRLFQLFDRHGVSKISVVQQITRQSRQGPTHHFRFYAGEEFFPEILLNGKRLVFTEHALQRFSSRVPNHVGTDLSQFLLCFFGAPMISLPVGRGRAFIVPYPPSLLAFTYKETETEFIITTCLTINEINSMEMEYPPRAYNLHYDDHAYTLPRVRNWFPSRQMEQFYDIYERKTPLPALKPPRIKDFRWARIASFALDMEKRSEDGPGSRLVFVDDMPGPNMVKAKPGQVVAQIDELALYKKHHPEHDWDRIFAEQLGLKAESTEKPVSHVPEPALAAA